MLSIILVPSSILLRLAIVALNVLGWTLHAVGTLLEIFAAAEVCCALLLVIAIGIFRIGLIPTKPRHPLLAVKSSIP